MNWRLLMGAAALLVGLAGCGEETTGPGEPGELVCAESETLCNGACADLAADPDNCGACGTACGAEEVCSGGACVLSCPTGQTACDGGCWNLQTSEQNCGACGEACGAGEACVDGACQLACPAGQLPCDGRCVDTDADPDHCGGCGVACSAGELCGDGSCVASCPATQEPCDGGCFNLENARAHCGACGVTCGDGEVCIDGTCGATCSPGTEACDGTCRDLQSDPNHCGMCNTACDSDEKCVAGSCQLLCANGLEQCDEACRDLQNDRNHCGGCGVTCAAGEICSGGQCAATCTGFADDECNGACTNTDADPLNCGGCGIACAAGEVCSAGTCSGVCAEGLDTCGGSCTDTSFDTANCGACGTACTAATNAAAVCASGACSSACLVGYGDCNADLGSLGTDGCEIALGTDVNHCGLCGNACSAPANATAACLGGVCGIGMCDAGFEDCNLNAADGCETNINSSASNCGGCGLACATGLVCTNGACSPPGPGENCLDPWVIHPGTNLVPTHHSFNDYFTFTPSCMTVGTPEGPDVILKYSATFTGEATLHFPNKPASTRWVAMVTEGVCGTPATGTIGDIDIACISDWSPTFMEGSFQVTQGTDYYIHLIDSTSGTLPLNNPVEVELHAFDCSSYVPVVSGTAPENGGITNGLAPTFEAYFAEPVNDTAGTVIVTSTGGVSLTFVLPSPAVTFSTDKKKMTIDPGVTFTAGDSISVTWSGLGDTACGTLVPAPAWTFTAAQVTCGPGTAGMVGANTTVVPSNSIGTFTDYYSAADGNPNGYVYVGGTTELYRMPKAGGFLEDIAGRFGLTASHLGYTMHIDGQAIYTADSKTTGTNGHLYRISNDGGTTWDPVDMAEFASVPKGGIESLASWGGRIYMMTNETTASVTTQIWSIDPTSATLPAAATLELEFGANAYMYCSGLVVDRDYFYVSCRAGSSGSNYVVLRITRANGTVVETASGLIGSTTTMALKGRDHNGDGIVDFLYRRANTSTVQYICGPASGAGIVGDLHTYGSGTSDYGIGYDPVGNVMWLFNDDDNSFVRLD